MHGDHLPCKKSDNLIQFMEGHNYEGAQSNSVKFLCMKKIFHVYFCIITLGQ